MAPMYSPPRPTGGASDIDSELSLPSRPFARMSSYDALKRSATDTIEPLSASSTFVASRANTFTPSKMNLEPEKDGKMRWKVGMLLHLDKDLARLIHPNNDLENLRPNLHSIIRVLVLFIGFAIILSAAARLPVEVMRWVVVSFGFISFFGAVFILRKDCWEYRQRIYRINLGNTALTVLITVPLFTILYALLWYGNLRNEILVTTTDSVSNIRYPSVALFQRNDWTAQAELLAKGPKCYLGWFDDDAPNCSSLTPAEYADGVNCNCQELWDTAVVEDFAWQGGNYSYLAFEAADWLLDDTPTHVMLLQAFFNYNGSAALATSSTPQSPSLWMAIYDAEVGLQTSLDAGYTRMTFINANGIVSVNADLRTRQTPGYPLAYDYSLSISSSPATDVVCDTSKPGSYPCHVTLFVQIPSFRRENIRSQKVMGWLDVAASAGAYFSFVQFLSWIISAQAFAI